MAVGSLALTNVTATANNVAVGRAALQNATGSGNTALGDRAGIVVTSGSNNILIGHVGQASDAAVTRLGTPGTQTKAYVAGVRGVTTATAAIPVLVGTDGQLGTVSSSRRQAGHRPLLLNELQRQQRVIDALVQRLQTLETARERR